MDQHSTSNIDQHSTLKFNNINKGTHYNEILLTHTHKSTKGDRSVPISSSSFLSTRYTWAISTWTPWPTPTTHTTHTHIYIYIYKRKHQRKHVGQNWISRLIGCFMLSLNLDRALSQSWLVRIEEQEKTHTKHTYLFLYLCIMPKGSK